MDCVEFASNINVEGDVHGEAMLRHIAFFFDQIMALYHLIGTCSDMSITSMVDNKMSIKFIIINKLNEESNILFQVLNNTRLALYHKTFIVSMKQLSSNSSSIQLIEEEVSG